MSKILIIGKGGHASVVKHDIIRENFCDYEIIQVEEGDDFPTGDFYVHIAIGDNYVRERISKSWPYKYINVGDDSFFESENTEIVGCYFGRSSFVGVNAKIGNFCILNTFSVLEHDSTLGDFSHICPGVVTGGNVKIGSRTTVGLNSSIRNGVSIGNNCVIGMASNVLKDIPDNCIAWGNPCKIIRQNGQFY